MAVDTAVQNATVTESEDNDYRTYNVRVHKSVSDAFDVATALQALAEDSETFGKLHFSHRPGRVGKKSGKLGPSMVTVDTIEKRRASAAGLDPEAQRIAARGIRAALKTSPALQSVLARLAKGEEVDQSEILANLDASTLAGILAATKPSTGRGRPKKEEAATA